MLQRFETELFNLSAECFHCDVMNPRPNSLIYSEGSANFNLFKLTPNAQYILSNPMLNLWKRTDIDSNIIKVFELMSNSKYLQTNTSQRIGRSYNLFLMQMASTVDLRFTVDALKYATEQKRFTVFKTHPAVGDGTDFPALWETFKKHRLVSDYTIMVDGDLQSLIDDADIVYSADSACTFNAMLKGIPVFNYRINEFSEIVPILDTSKDMPITIIDHEDLLRFLSWYYHKLSIDVNQDSFPQRLQSILEQHLAGKPISEIFL